MEHVYSKADGDAVRAALMREPEASGPNAWILDHETPRAMMTLVVGLANVASAYMVPGAGVRVVRQVQRGAVT